MYSYCLSSFLSGSNLGVILLAAAALPVLVAGEYLVEVFQNGTDVVVQASGSLITDGLAPVPDVCGFENGAIFSDFVCVGPSGNLFCYDITGPSDLSGGPDPLRTATSFAGVTSALSPRLPVACVPEGYTSGELNGTSVYQDTTLEALNFTEAVNLTWTFNGSASGETARFEVLVPTTAAPVVAPTMAPAPPAAGEYLVEVFQNGTDVVVQASGSLITDGLPQFSTEVCPFAFGGIGSDFVCVGPLGAVDCYNITGPSAVSGGPVPLRTANSSTAVGSGLSADVGLACVPFNYTSGDPLDASSVYQDTTLDDLNFTEAVELMWTFDNSDGSASGQTARFVVLVPTTPAPVVAPTMAPMVTTPTMAPMVTPTMAPVVVSPTPTDNKCYVDHDYYGASSKSYDDSKFLRGGEEYDLGEICPHTSYELKVCCLVNDGDDAAACVSCDACAINEAVNDGCCAWEWWDDEDKNGDDRHSRRNLDGVYYGGCIHQYEDKNYQCCKCEEFYRCAGPEEDCMTVCMANPP